VQLPLPVLIGGGLLGVVVLVLATALLRDAGRVYGEEPSAVVEATRGGPIELAGTAEVANETLTGEFSGEECVAFHYEVGQRDQDRERGFRTIEEGNRGVPFHLRDDTGTVLVDPVGATLTFDEETVETFLSDETPPARIRMFIEDVDEPRRYAEQRLEVGATAHVVGTARPPDDPPAELGDVDAVVGAPDVGSGSLAGSWMRRIAGQPFVIGDGARSATGWELAKPGLLLAVVGVGLLAAMVWVGHPV